MFLLIWSIYVIVEGKFQLAKYYGVTGDVARFCGVFNLFVFLWLDGAVIPLGQPLIYLGVQLALIVIVGLVAVAVHGNDFKKPSDSDGKTVEVGPQSNNGSARLRLLRWILIGFLSVIVLISYAQWFLDRHDIERMPAIDMLACAGDLKRQIEEQKDLDGATCDELRIEWHVSEERVISVKHKVQDGYEVTIQLSGPDKRWRCVGKPKRLMPKNCRGDT